MNKYKYYLSKLKDAAINKDWKSFYYYKNKIQSLKKMTLYDAYAFYIGVGYALCEDDNKNNSYNKLNITLGDYGKHFTNGRNLEKNNIENKPSDYFKSWDKN